MATVHFSNFFNANYGTLQVGTNTDFMLLNNNPLDDLNTLKNVLGVYYNYHFLDKKALDVRRSNILKTIENRMFTKISQN